MSGRANNWVLGSGADFPARVLRQEFLTGAAPRVSTVKNALHAAPDRKVMPMGYSLGRFNGGLVCDLYFGEDQFRPAGIIEYAGLVLHESPFLSSEQRSIPPR